MNVTPYYGVGAGASGRYVWVRYVLYQGHTNITRDEALDYLAGLDGGFIGRHFEWQRRAKE